MSNEIDDKKEPFITIPEMAVASGIAIVANIVATSGLNSNLNYAMGAVALVGAAVAIKSFVTRESKGQPPRESTDRALSNISKMLEEKGYDPQGKKDSTKNLSSALSSDESSLSDIMKSLSIADSEKEPTVADNLDISSGQEGRRSPVSKHDNSGLNL